MQVKDLTTEELKALIRETITQTLKELLIEQKKEVSQKPVVAQPQQVVETDIQETAPQTQPSLPPSEEEAEDTDSLDIPIRETAKELGLFINQD